MYIIEGVFDMKWYPDGSVSRMKSAFTQPLNTEHGVIAFMKEQRPFFSIKITDTDTNKDVTVGFLKLVDQRNAVNDPD